MEENLQAWKLLWADCWGWRLEPFTCPRWGTGSSLTSFWCPAWLCTSQAPGWPCSCSASGVTGKLLLPWFCFAFSWRKWWFCKMISFGTPQRGRLPTSSRWIPHISCAVLPMVSLWKGGWEGGSSCPAARQSCGKRMQLSEARRWEETWKNTVSRRFLNSFSVTGLDVVHLRSGHMSETKMSFWSVMHLSVFQFSCFPRAAERICCVPHCGSEGDKRLRSLLPLEVSGSELC